MYFLFFFFVPEGGLTCVKALHEGGGADEVARAKLAHNVRVHLPQLELDLYIPQRESLRAGGGHVRGY